MVMETIASKSKSDDQNRKSTADRADDDTQNTLYVLARGHTARAAAHESHDATADTGIATTARSASQGHQGPGDAHAARRYGKT